MLINQPPCKLKRFAAPGKACGRGPPSPSALHYGTQTVHDSARSMQPKKQVSLYKVPLPMMGQRARMYARELSDMRYGSESDLPHAVTLGAKASDQHLMSFRVHKKSGPQCWPKAQAHHLRLCRVRNACRTHACMRAACGCGCPWQTAAVCTDPSTDSLGANGACASSCVAVG